MPTPTKAIIDAVACRSYHWCSRRQELSLMQIPTKATIDVGMKTSENIKTVHPKNENIENLSKNLFLKWEG